MLRIESAAALIVGQPAEFWLRSVPAPDQPAGPLSAKWFVDGRIVQEVGGTLIHTLQRVGELTIRAEAATPNVARSTEIVLPVRALDSATAPTADESDLRQTEWMQFLIFGTLIVFTGTFLFQNTFIGTAEDFGSAFMWGFTVDVGFAKVRELAAPLLSRVSTPAGRNPV